MTDSKGNITQAAFSDVSLKLLPAGDYVIQIVGQYSDTNPSFELRLDDADHAFENIALQPVPVSIKDNDLPQAEIMAGPTASEVSSQASYFAVRLNAPAASTTSDTGVKVNFKVSGGRASQGTASSLLHDYTVVADSFDATTGIGWVRVAPGDIQANIGIIPVDDKLVEDLPLLLREFSTASGSQIRVAASPKLVEASGATGPNYLVRKGTQITGRLPSGQEVVFTVRTDTNLVKGTYSLPAGGTRREYAAVVPIDLTASSAASDRKLVTNLGTTEFDGRIRSEDVEVTILPGSGYVLPLAPDKQAADPNVAANLDPARTTARLIIFDDDVPGVQIFETREHTTLSEGTEATFQVALTAEPLTDVRITLSSNATTFVNSQGKESATFTRTQYTQGGTLPAGLSLHFVSLNETDLGSVAVFDTQRTAVTQENSAKVSKLTLSSVNGGSGVAEFEVPGVNNIDASGNPESGNWSVSQRVIVPNLIRSEDGSFSITVNLDGDSKTIVLTPFTETLSPGTTTLTFSPADWYKPQTVKIRALNNSVAEPGEWHKEQIQYTVSSIDGNWNKLNVPAQDLHIEDVLLNVGDTVEAVRSGLNALQDSLLGLQMPLVGSVGNLPGVSSLFRDILGPLQSSLAGQDELTTTKFKSLAESSLQSLLNRGSSGNTFDRIEVTPEAVGEESHVKLDIEKRFKVGSMSLSTDLGLDALGLKFQTLGKASVEVVFELKVGIGLSPKFGIFLDTSFTRLHLGTRLILEGNGATASNPQNLFTGQGSLGFLQLDFQDDPLNRTELGVTFDVTMNDLDNLNTVRFFDINGDGLLAEKAYAFKVGTDANKDGHLDLDSNGDPILHSTTVAEPWSNITRKGFAEPFPTVSQLKTSTTLGKAVQANWNTVGPKTNTFDEATSIRNEGIYRVLTQGDKTVAFLDSDRDGELDISKKLITPFNSPWNRLTQSQKETSEVWFTVSSPKQIGELRVLVTGAGSSAKFFIDVNQNGRAEADEEVPEKLAKKLDKNSSRVLEADVRQDGEGRYVQGTGLAFYDRNLNGRMDSDEVYINYGFDDFQLSESVFFTDTTGARFLDLNSDGFFGNGTLGNTQRYQEFRLRTTDAGRAVYIDINGNSTVDPKEYQASVDRKSPETSPPKSKFIIPQANVKPATSFPGVYDSSVENVIDFGGLVMPVRTVSGARFIDIDQEVDPVSGATGRYRQLGAEETVRFIDLDNNGQLTLDRFGRSLEPYAVQSSHLGLEALARLVTRFNQADASLFSSLPAEVTKLTTTGALTPTEEVRVRGKLEELIFAGKVVMQLNDGNRLTLAELRAFAQSTRAKDGTKSTQLQSVAAQLFTYQFQGNANLGLKAKTSINGSDVLPSIQFDLAVNLPLFNYGNSKQANDDGMTVEFRKVALDLGSFLNKFVTPIVNTANDIVTPIKPIIAALNADTKLLSYIGLASSFESDGKPGVSLLEIARKLSTTPAQKAKIDRAIKFADQLSKIVDVIDVLQKNLNSQTSLLQFGDFSLKNLRGASKDRSNAVNAKTRVPRADGAPSTSSTTPATTAADLDRQASRSSTASKNKYQALKQLDGFSIKLFEPATLLSLIKGDSAVNLITYDIPDFDFAFNMEKKFSIWGPLAGKLEGGFRVATDLSMGFDTHGFEEWARDGYNPDHSNLIFDGLYFDDVNLAGADKDELTVNAFLSAGLGLDIGIASGFVKGGVEGIIGLDLVDVGEQTGTSDGRIRGSDIFSKLANNPADLFDLHGVINAFLGAEVTVDFFFYSAKVYEARLATIELAKFKLDSSGFSGSSMNGKVQAGPLAHSTVWFDANNNYVLDAGEPSTTTDFEGHYSLIIPDESDMSSGVIRTQGGIDISTGLEATDDLAIPPGGHGNATAFTALEESLVHLPIDIRLLDFNHDSKADAVDRTAYLNLLAADPASASLDINGDGVINAADLQEFDELLESVQRDGKPTISQAQAMIERAFGIDSSIDLSTFLHFDEELAGNPLATPVFLGENIVNTAVTHLEAVLAGLSGVGQNDHQYSGLFSEAAFLAIGQRLMQLAPGQRLDLSDTPALLAIIRDAATIARDLLADAGVTVTIDMARLNQVINDVADVMHASAANAEALAHIAADASHLEQLITEWKVFENGKVTHDLFDLVKGVKTPGQVVSEDGRTDSGILDEISHIPLPPLLSAVPDVFLFEDQSVSDMLLSVRRQMHDAGTVTLQTATDNSTLLPAGSVTLVPGSSAGQYRLSIHPAANQHGVSHVTIRATDSDGGMIEEVILVTVEASNDVPQPVSDTLFALAGSTVTLNVLGNDQDVDGDTLHLAGLTRAPTSGSVVLPGDETVRYTLDRNARGPQTMSYEVEDRNGGEAQGQVSVYALAPLTVDHSYLAVSASSAVTNSGTLAYGNSVTAVLSASVGQVINHGDGTWEWRMPTGQAPDWSRPVTVTARYNGSVEDQVTFRFASLSVNNVDLVERNAGRSDAVFTVSLSGAVDKPVTVTWQTKDRTGVAAAASGTDYLPVRGQLVFNLGETKKTVRVPVRGDNVVELDESFGVLLSGAVNATIATAEGTGLIRNDDVSAGISDVTIREGDLGTKNAVFTVSLSRPQRGGNVTVQFATADGTGIAGLDYVATSGLLTFAPGVVSRTIIVPITDDRLNETAETFVVNLSSVTGAVLNDSQGAGLILDNDPRPAISIRDASVTEGTATATFTVTLSAAAGIPVTVNYATANRSATRSSDYTAKAGTLTFAPGETIQTISVAIIDDAVFEDAEWFVVKLAGAANAVFARSSAVGTIVDNDSKPTLSVADVTVIEGTGSDVFAVFTVNLSAASSSMVSVSYSTSARTAVSPRDFARNSGVLQFRPGETTKTIRVAVAGDSDHEADETFTLDLQWALNALMADAQAIGTILDND